MITLTREAWGKFAPGCPATWTEALFANLDLLEQHGILETELRWCHFAGTVYEETGNFRELRENLYYTTLGALRRAWPSRFGHMSDAEARTFLRNPRALSNKTYNGRMGNRAGSSDGYDFRGGGWIQTTGRSAVEEYCKQLGITPGPGTLDDPLTTLQFAVLEWTSKDCNKWADENNIVKIAKAINTGSADSNVTPVGMDLRRSAFARAWKQWGEYGVADQPAKPVGPQEYGTATVLSVAATEGVHQASNISSLMNLDSVEQVVNTGQRVRGVSEQGTGLLSWFAALASPEIMALGALSIGGAALIYFLCFVLPARRR